MKYCFIVLFNNIVAHFDILSLSGDNKARLIAFHSPSTFEVTRIFATCCPTGQEATVWVLQNVLFDGSSLSANEKKGSKNPCTSR